ncbi:unnamed protein product [Rotaria sordida]|uniref:FLYWCH-type domain-containing protein n=1 Tax=Rotaria sordida TaxID=392033 RepID=A0A814F9G5_9BILA|nr:unnamed protein product [Rotaria sordida]CAF1056745.1 unnamed protein product [Rotaria sordida]
MAEAAASSSDTTQAKSPAISFINSDKEKSLLIVDEYVFKLNKTTATTKYWICTLNGCSAKFTAGLEARPKQAKTFAIQRRMDNLGKRYYDGAINP